MTTPDPRSLAANPVVRELYQHRSEPDVIHYVAVDSRGERHRLSVRLGDPLYAVLLDRLEALKLHLESLRSDKAQTRIELESSEAP